MGRSAHCGIRVISGSSEAFIGWSVQVDPSHFPPFAVLTGFRGCLPSALPVYRGGALALVESPVGFAQCCGQLGGYPRPASRRLRRRWRRRWRGVGGCPCPGRVGHRSRCYRVLEVRVGYVTRRWVMSLPPSVAHRSATTRSGSSRICGLAWTPAGSRPLTFRRCCRPSCRPTTPTRRGRHRSKILSWIGSSLRWRRSGLVRLVWSRPVYGGGPRQQCSMLRAAS